MGHRRLTEDGRPGTSDGRSSWVFWLVLTGAVLVYLGRAVHFNFIADDAFISFRYARNLSRGWGLVFNPGERVEGYTNFLLVVILAGLNRAGADIVRAGRVISLVAGCAVVALTGLIARRAAPDNRWGPVAAASLVAVNPFVAVWGAAGLETTMFGALLLAMALPLVGVAPSRERFLASSLWALLLAMTRPEGVALYGVLTATILLSPQRASARQRLSLVVPGVLMFVTAGGAYFLWRWHYFGELLPNTYAAKGALSLTQVVLGASYVVAFFGNVFVSASVPFAIEGGRVTWRNAPLLSVLLVAAVLIPIGEGGDGPPMYRFLVPAVPLSCALTALGLTGRSVQALKPPARWLFPAFLTGVFVALSFFPRHDEQYNRYLRQRDYEIPRWRAVGLALHRALPQDAMISAVPIGAVGWYSDLPVVDMLGLTDRTIAQRAIDPSITWEGHQKHDGAYVVARRPAALLLGNVFVDESAAPPPVPLPRVGPQFLPREGDVLAQPSFAENYELASVPVGSGWFLHCYLRHDVARSLVTHSE